MSLEAVSIARLEGAEDEACAQERLISRDLSEAVYLSGVPT